MYVNVTGTPAVHCPFHVTVLPSPTVSMVAGGSASIIMNVGGSVSVILPRNVTDGVTVIVIVSVASGNVRVTECRSMSTGRSAATSIIVVARVVASDRTG